MTKLFGPGEKDIAKMVNTALIKCVKAACEDDLKELHEQPK